MEILVLLGLAVAAFLFLPNLLADEKTKLFRRVWSTELGRSTEYKSDQQWDAVTRLFHVYQIEKNSKDDELLRNIASLMADALTFDMKNPRNLGVEVTKVLARTVRIRFPNLGN